jgi:hypothetical protein
MPENNERNEKAQNNANNNEKKKERLARDTRGNDPYARSILVFQA